MQVKNTLNNSLFWFLIGALVGGAALAISFAVMTMPTANGPSDISLLELPAQTNGKSSAMVVEECLSSTLSGKPIFQDISEIILVVNDLEASMKKQWEMFGIGPWEIWTFDSSTVENMFTHDEQMDFAILIAYTKIGNIYWELVQPLDDKSTYYETLRDHGEGVHNIVFDVEDFDETMSFMRDNCIGIYNAGNWQGTTFVNFETRPHLPIIAEIYKTEDGAAFPPPDSVYPEASEE